MTSTPDEDVLIPAPAIFRLGDKEIRIVPLPTRRVKELIRAVEKNKDVFDKLPQIMEIGVGDFLSQEVYVRVNSLLRMVVSPATAHEFLTDEWCDDNMTHAHYRAIFMTVLKQNELYDVFLKAKGFVGSHMGTAFRQVMSKMEAPDEA